MARVALLSGGKDSFYAALHYWPPDYGLILHYSFPEPSPHLVNLGKSVETLLLAGVRVVVARLPRGREREETVRILRGLGASEIVAGDVYIEDHLRYMESVASEAGAKLREPLWGRDPIDVVHGIVEAGLEATVIGVRGPWRGLLGFRIRRDTVDGLIGMAKRWGFDPLGERGEYHTILEYSPRHSERLKFGVAGRVEQGNVVILRLV